MDLKIQTEKTLHILSHDKLYVLSGKSLHVLPDKKRRMLRIGVYRIFSKGAGR